MKYVISLSLVFSSVCASFQTSNRPCLKQKGESTQWPTCETHACCMCSPMPCDPHRNHRIQTSSLCSWSPLQTSKNAYCSSHWKSFEIPSSPSGHGAHWFKGSGSQLFYVFPEKCKEQGLWLQFQRSMKLCRDCQIMRGVRIKKACTICLYNAS